MTVESVAGMERATTTIRPASNDSDAVRWEEFVNSHSQCSSYHRWNWKRVFENAFGWPTFYLMAEEGGKLRGILPLIWQKNWPFGGPITSMPHLKGGGIAAESHALEEQLLQEAIGLVKHLKAHHLELRQSDDHLGLPMRTDKVTFVLPVYRDTERMWKAIPSNARYKVRKSMQCGLTAEFDSSNGLDDFYGVYSQNMRELGSPTYSRDFFRQVQVAFPKETHICVIRHQGKGVAASFLVGYRGNIEAIWTSSLREYLPLKPNMFMYWSLLCFAGERGYQYFDFGRCTVGSGVYEFKSRWRPKEIPLYWSYWLRNTGDLPTTPNASTKYRFASWVWQRLPLPMTRAVGPTILKRLTGI